MKQLNAYYKACEELKTAFLVTLYRKHEYPILLITLWVFDNVVIPGVLDISMFSTSNTSYPPLLFMLIVSSLCLPAAK